MLYGCNTFVFGTYVNRGFMYPEWNLLPPFLWSIGEANRKSLRRLVLKFKIFLVLPSILECSSLQRSFTEQYVEGLTGDLPIAKKHIPPAIIVPPEDLKATMGLFASLNNLCLIGGQRYRCEHGDQETLTILRALLDWSGVAPGEGPRLIVEKCETLDGDGMEYMYAAWNS